jgi:Tfp pilus assembly protein PilV
MHERDREPGDWTEDGKTRAPYWAGRTGATQIELCATAAATTDRQPATWQAAASEPPRLARHASGVLTSLRRMQQAETDTFSTSAQ